MSLCCLNTVTGISLKQAERTYAKSSLYNVILAIIFANFFRKILFLTNHPSVDEVLSERILNETSHLACFHTKIFIFHLKRNI